MALISGAAAGSYLGELFGWRAVFLIAAGFGILDAFLHTGDPLFLPCERTAMRQHVLDDLFTGQGRAGCQCVDAPAEVIGYGVLICHRVV